MEHTLSRRGFLTGGRATTAPRPAGPRPPWAVADFAQRCDGCGACVTACPLRLIETDSDRRPAMNFNQGGCDFCGACARACPSGALGQSGTPATAWPHKAVVGAGCLAVKGVTCQVCADFCEPRALHLPLMVGGRRLPLIKTTTCTGCGGCVAPCPTHAITLA